MRRTWAIARTELVRLFRDRANIFFVFVFPLLLVVLIGAQFGEAQDTRLGVVLPANDAAAAELVAQLERAEGISTERFEDAEQLRAEVSRGLLSAGVVVPEGYGQERESVTPTTIDFLGRPDPTSQSLQALVGSVVARQAEAGQAAAIAATQMEEEAATLRPVVQQLREQVVGVEVTTEQVGVDELGEEFAGLGQFDLGASSQLFLFTFLTAMSGGVALIQTRQLGVARRMLSTSTPMTVIVAGQTAGRLLTALTQALYIVVASVLLFGVDWGDPLATAAVVLLFSLVAAAAGLLLGATLRNDSQAGGAAVGLGLGLAALGGSMVPLEIFPETMRQVARLTPHAWANEAMAEIVRRGGTVLDVLPQLGVLAAMAVVLLALGSYSLQRTLTR